MKMKKIILFVLMIIASVNLFSNELPDNIYYYFLKSNVFYNKVSEDFINNDNLIELDYGYKLGMFDDASFGHFIYKIKVTNNERKRITLVILNNEYTYCLVHIRAESASGLLSSFYNIRVFNEEDLYVYEGSQYSEDGNLIYDCHYDYTTSTYYSNVNN